MNPSRRGFLGLLAAAPIAAPAAAREMAKPALASGGWVRGESLPLTPLIRGHRGVITFEVDTSAVTAEIERIKDAARLLNLPIQSGATEAVNMPGCPDCTPLALPQWQMPRHEQVR